MSDLFHRERFAAKLGEILDYHNFILQRYYQAAPVEFQHVLESSLELGERVKPLVADVTGILEELSVDGRNVLFEGAQGAMLDVDLGTYPFVTSSTTTAGGAAAGTGLGPRRLHDVLGIVKAYATRVGAGPFPTELFDECGEHLSRVGHEFGSVTGRRRRCGWFDAVALRRSIVHSSCSSLCVTKLDVLDGLDTIRVCVGYRIDGETVLTPPLLSERPGNTKRFTKSIPGGRKAALASRDMRSCRPMPVLISSVCRHWSAFRSPSSPPVPIATRPSFDTIPSRDVRATSGAAPPRLTAVGLACAVALSGAVAAVAAAPAQQSSEATVPAPGWMPVELPMSAPRSRWLR